MKLPINIYDTTPYEDIGFVLDYKNYDGGDLINCELPKDWYRIADFILDDKARRRIVISEDFHYCGILSRFNPSVDMDNDLIWAVVYNQDAEIWRSDPHKIIDDNKQIDEIDQLGEDWLDQNYPDWEKYWMYWD